SAAVANFFIITLAVWWPAVGQGAPRVLILAAGYLFLAVVNIRGTRSGARLSIATALIKLTPLALLAVAGCFAIHSTNLHWSGLPSLKSVGQSAVILLFAFMGIEGGLNASGEVVNPVRTVPRAIAMALILASTLYIGLQFAAQGVL